MASDTDEAVEHGGSPSDPAVASREAGRQARHVAFFTLPLAVLYMYVIMDSIRGGPFERAGAIMLFTIVFIVLIGGIVFGLRPEPMYYVFMLAAVLQTFAMVFMILITWLEVEVTLFTNTFLVVCLLLAARVCRRLARPRPS